MTKLLTYILTGAVFAAVGSSEVIAEGRDSGDSRSRKCSAELKRAGGDRAHCLLDAEARFQKTGKLDRLMKKIDACDRRFDRAFDRALRRHSDTDCVAVSKAELMNETDSYVDRYSNSTEGIANDPLGQSGPAEVKGIFHRGANPYIPDGVTHVALFNGGTTGGLGSASGGADVSSWFASCNKGGGNQFENIPEGVKQYITVGGGAPQFLPVWADVKELAGPDLRGQAVIARISCQLLRLCQHMCREPLCLGGNGYESVPQEHGRYCFRPGKRYRCHYGSD